MTFTKRKSILACLLLGAGTVTAFAHGGATGIVKERMDAMEEIGDAMKSIGQMLRGNAEIDAGKIARSAGVIAAHSGDALTKLFPEGSLHAPSEASPKIWQDWAGFQSIAADLNEAAAILSNLSKDNGANSPEGRKALETAFGKVAGTCKSCHQDFRIKKD